MRQIKDEFFPLALRGEIEKLSEEETAPELCRIFAQAISVLAKLALLEYAQCPWRSAEFNYWLFSQLESEPQWLEIFRRIATEMERRGVPFVLPLAELYEKYPYLQEEGKGTRLKRLAAFRDLVDALPFLVSSSDILEHKECLVEFLDEFAFLEQLDYKREQISRNGRSLSSSPFFTALMEDDKPQLKVEKSGLEDFCREWLAEEHSTYCRQKVGDIDFSPIIARHRHHTLPPWTEISVREVFSDIFQIPVDMGLRRVLIEGPPASGKTALLSNLEYLIAEYCNHIRHYFVHRDIACRESAVFQQWLERSLGEILKVPEKSTDATLYEQLQQSEAKIVIAVDSLELMPATEFEKLQTLVSNEAFASLVFVFCVRTNSVAPISIGNKIQLQAEDNPYFIESFNRPYIASLIADYIGGDPLAQMVYNALTEDGWRYRSIPQLAEQLDVYAPRLLKVIHGMKPFLEIEKERETGIKFRLFHPICLEFRIGQTTSTTLP